MLDVAEIELGGQAAEGLVHFVDALRTQQNVRPAVDEVDSSKLTDCAKRAKAMKGSGVHS